MKDFKFIDLFSGIGGFRIALDNLGGECVFSSDIDNYAAQTYYNNFNEYPSGDISEIDEKDIPDHDVLCAGFPCQPFSLAGRRLGFEDTRGTLFFEVSRIINEKKPKIIFLENVAGIVSHDKGQTLSVIEEVISDLGYIFHWQLMNAKEYGIPQNRNRWYFIGIRNDLSVTKKDIETVYFNKRDLDFTLEDILDLNVSKEYEISKTAKKNIDKNLDEYLDNKPETDVNILIANNVRPSKVSFSANNISPCLTAKMGTGGNNVPILYSQNRKLTVRECLNIMGFPKDFKIKENYMQSYKQVGNSVVVPIIEKLLKNTIELLSK